MSILLNLANMANTFPVSITVPVAYHMFSICSLLIFIFMHVCVCVQVCGFTRTCIDLLVESLSPSLSFLVLGSVLCAAVCSPLRRCWQQSADRYAPVSGARLTELPAQLTLTAFSVLFASSCLACWTWSGILLPVHTR